MPSDNPLMQLERTPDERNFGNGTWPDDEPPDWKWPKESPKVLLRRLELPKRRFGLQARVEEFELQLPITYRDDSRGPGAERVITVPDPGYPFTTDLTSVPRLLTWLVPKSGRHLPAALVHDGLVGGAPASYLVDGTSPDERTRIDRIDADAIFRNAMHDMDVRLVRRWLVWAAVANASLLTGARAGWTWQRWWFRVVGLLVLLLIVWCGVSATLEVFNAATPPLGDLIWIDSDEWWLRILQGLAGAIVIPLALALLWGRYYRAGAIAGVALATVFHATVAVALVAVFYAVIELIARNAAVACLFAAAVAGSALALFLGTAFT